jgi:acylphosphatase
MPTTSFVQGAHLTMADSTTDLNTTEQWRIEGRVQGVGYRAWFQHAALAHGLTGWVRNRRDGSVEALVCGPLANRELLYQAALDGPPMARVASIMRAPSNAQVTGFACLETV